MTRGWLGKISYTGETLGVLLVIIGIVMSFALLIIEFIYTSFISFRWKIAISLIITGIILTVASRIVYEIVINNGEI